MPSIARLPDDPDEPSTTEIRTYQTPFGDSLANIAQTIARAPAGQQLAFGGVGGWCLGYTFMKVGKAVAITVGGGLLLLHIASYNGYVKVNWPKADSQIKQLRKRLEKELGVARDPSTVEKVLQFAKDHAYLAGGLVGGFFLGIGSA